MIITYTSGPFEAKEVIKECSQDASHPVVGSEALSQLVNPRQRFAYDLIVAVGLARYLHNKQREEIRAELLDTRGIELSDGSVSNLCDRFLICLEALHLAMVPSLRAAIQKDGYPLHLDATSDRGKGGLFVCMDGWRKWVLTAGRIPSEAEEHLWPLIEKTVELFGDPVATIRDLGPAVGNAVAPLRERGIVDLVCHYHFLGAVGEKLFDSSYSRLRNSLRQSKVRGELRKLLRELKKYRKSETYQGRFGAGGIRQDLLALVHWVLESDGRKRALYPFGLPHREFVQRCRQAMQRSDYWVPCPRSQAEGSAIEYLKSLVARLDSDEQLCLATGELEKAWRAFSELRGVLRLSDAELPRGDVRYGQTETPMLEVERLKEIGTATQKYREELESRVAGHGKSKVLTPEGVVLGYLDSYSEKLFGHPVLRDENGLVISIVERTNNIPEHFFGRAKQQLRRRLGRAHLGRDLEDQPAQAALAGNLRHPDYVRIVCGSLENLPVAFADLEQQALQRVSGLARSNRDTELQGRVRTLLEQEGEIAIDNPNNAIDPSQIALSATVV